MENKNEMSRNFALVTYLHESKALELCQRQNVMHYAIKTHDKDDGKEKHVHVVVRYNNPRSLDSVRSEWKKAGIGIDNGKDVNTLVEVCRDLENAYQYLIHANDKEKYQYEEKDIWTDNAGYFRGDYSSAKCKQRNAEHSENTAFQILLDMESNVPLRELARRYGREIILNYSKYNDFLYLVKHQEERKENHVFEKAVRGHYIDENGEVIKHSKEIKNED